MNPQDLANFQDALERALNVIAYFKGTLTPREKLVLELGLRSAHAEEALATGETERAREHFTHVVQIAQQLV
jgi:hypothetical protein